MKSILKKENSRMVDLQHSKLIVDRIEYDRDYVYNVMKETDNIHIDNVSSLIDETGKSYNLYICNTRNGSTPERRVYAIQFDDNAMLPIGTVLTVGPQHWRKEIPESEPIKIEYKRSIIALNLECSGFELTVDLQGKVCFKQFFLDDSSNDSKEIEIVDTSISKDFLHEMLRCVSDKDCYNGYWTDDTSRRFLLYFEDGTILEYSGVYLHQGVVTESIVDEFITNLGLSCKPWI